MDIIVDTVNRLEQVVSGSGCEDGGVVLKPDPDKTPCQYDRGAMIESWFGGRTAEFTTSEPLYATTRVSYMFGAALETLQLRAAACAIVNVLCAFLCIIRIRHSCKKECHRPCLQELARFAKGRSVYCIPEIPAISRGTEFIVADCPEQADIILVNGNGVISPEGDRIVTEYRELKILVLLGPSTGGVAALQKIKHFCPYGAS